jgi:GNAT superfamily N-acetyltransferase
MFTLRVMKPEDALSVVQQAQTLLGEMYQNERPEGFYLHADTLVAIEDNRVIGHTTWHLILPRIWILDETYVDPEHRGKGVGAALFAQREVLIGPDQPTFGAVEDENEPMVKLLLKHGYHPCQRIAHKNMMLYSRGHDHKKE